MQFNEIMSFVYNFLYFLLGDGMLYVQVNTISIMSGSYSVFLCSRTKQRIKCLAQEDNTAPPVSLEVATLPSQAYEILILIALV